MRTVLACAFGLVLGGAGACGGVQYAVAINAAASRVEEARTLGADQLSPYDYYFAREHLEQAQVEASEASYSDAVTLAREAEEHASVAIEVARKARQSTP
jgi:hypothetical protein